MITLLIPMAGRGQRFAQAGYTVPKPFIDVLGRPMLQRVLDNIPGQQAQIVLAVLEAHEPMVTAFIQQAEGDHVSLDYFILPEVTGGAACTVLASRPVIEAQGALNRPLLIANVDQYLDWCPAHFAEYSLRRQADGVIPIFYATGPKWSYVQREYNGRISYVVEKQPVSTEATCGLYWFRTAALAYQAIEGMIAKRLQVNGEYYLAPVYNELILGGAHLLAYPVPHMWGLGTPEDLSAALADEHFRQLCHI